MVICFNGAPSLDGGELPRTPGLPGVGASLQWGPVSRRGGTFDFQFAVAIRDICFNGAPSLDGGEQPGGLLLGVRPLLASMGPRLSTGGNARGRGYACIAFDALQWGPVSRRGGTGPATLRRALSAAASMGPRL